MDWRAWKVSEGKMNMKLACTGHRQEGMKEYITEANVHNEQQCLSRRGRQKNQRRNIELRWRRRYLCYCKYWQEEKKKL